ncbi:uncharacterized protein LOC121398212 [Xenopus laevis]|uniref:Uncharacterized protein LOC121398212 n=1 Tax=Xenopus laevis TaxID=8355 RepID=A0A8J1LUJ1_XENLA|nr:uncharacterized protein LOC121398212 [Xenopus laevis]OCT59062.1 hypothetical protein XELAEV_18001550mg [Xenopus laevis]
MDETGGIRKILDETLKNLSRNIFTSFKRRLLTCKIPEGYNQIPWNELESADAENTVDLIFRYYTTEHAADIVLAVLDYINERQAGLEMSTKLMKNDATTKHHKQYKREKDYDETIPKNKTGSDGSIEITSRITMYSQKDQNPKEKLVHASQLPLTKNIDSRSYTTKLTESNTQEQKNKKLIHSPAPPAIPTPTPKISGSSTLESSVECTKAQPKSTTKGSTSSSSNICAGKLGNQAKNISQVQETVGNKKQSGNPGLSHSQNVQCKVPEPRPEAAGNVPALPNKTSHHKPDCTQQCHVPKRIPPRGKPLPDLFLRELDEKNLAVIEANHNGKPHIFAKFLFHFFVPFEIYTGWTKQTNFDGYGGKNAIPNNLREALFKHVKNKFYLQENDIKKIRETINDLLRKPRTAGWPVLIEFGPP